MYRFRKVLLMLGLLTLVGCGEVEAPEPEPTPEPTPPPLHEVASGYVWDGISIGAITPCNAYEMHGDELQIFPYYDSSEYIYLKKIVISENNFWDVVIADYKGTDNYYKGKEFDMVALDSGTVIAYKPIDDDYSYVAVSTTLPSSYVRAAMQLLCQ